jgi:UDP-glucose 4-epimerase
VAQRVIVTGGGGFIGAHLVKKLVLDGWNVGVVDTMARGDVGRFREIAEQVELFTTDVRDEAKMCSAFKGADVVIHLAAINGTENFYKYPELVLDVGLRGALAVVNACKRVGVHDLVVASSAEVYQTPMIVPTPETVPLMLPNSLNPRYSYGGSKIVSELIAFNYAQEHFRKLQVFRPHNVYGPDMGWKHVMPQFILRAAEVLKKSRGNSAPFPIQGDGTETRAFCYVDDIVDGILTMYQHGGHREIYHIGNEEEIAISDLVSRIGRIMGGALSIVPTTIAKGATPRRCPDITKMRTLGYEPKVRLNVGLRKTVEWYLAHFDDVPVNDLM